jgi:hypothetical protein
MVRGKKSSNCGGRRLEGLVFTCIIKVVKINTAVIVRLNAEKSLPEGLFLPSLSAEGVAPRVRESTNTIQRSWYRYMLFERKESAMRG